VRARTSSQARRRALDGALAGAAALAAVWLLVALEPAAPFAPLALADRVVRVTPGDVAAWLIDHLGHDAQRLLAGVAVAAFVGLAAVLSAGGGRARAPFAFGACIAAAAWTEPGRVSMRWSLIAAVFAAGVFAASLALLRSREIAVEPFARARIDRRAAIALIAASTGALLGARLLTGVRRAGVTLASPFAATVDDDFPAIRGLSPHVTPVADHYIVDIDLTDPVLGAADWRLRVDGHVDRPLTFSFDDLQRRFELVAEYSTLTCISNEVGGELVGSSEWLGVRLGDVLAACGVRAGAQEVALDCADGYSAGLPLGVARHPSTLVALGQNGKALTREHGFPCRIRAPALYGMMNAKWLERIEVLDHPYAGYWQRAGWTANAEVRTESRIDAVTPREAGQGGWIAGVAWAGIRGVAAVEISTDGGRSWHRARLRTPLSPWAWTQWALAWTPPAAGRYEITCRATDGEGHTQDARSRPPHPSGASGYDRVAMTIA
jgi:DMSO/TMAO reductase YedYZ molybdopterin-dependent catalytic subunit